MRYVNFIAMLLLAATICSCEANKSSEIYAEGVSWELALWRKSIVHDLKYELKFSIPESKAQAIEAEAKIRFRLDKSEEIVLDFRQSADMIGVVEMNGQKIEYEVRNEHIVIPKSASQAGENEVYITFTAADQSLNRNDEFLYTLLVPDRARTLFPCFEQPNLKAEFTLHLDVPKSWEVVSNTSVAEIRVTGDRKYVSFNPTEPLSTYLFSFVAGKLSKTEYKDGDRVLTAYYRETDPKRIAQLDDIFHQVAHSLHWLEDYTAIPYPFAKYDFIILPGFQYGGMEHTGATLYNDTQMFLSEHPTPDEELRRTSLIAHETAHMWFGDYVTMNWFDDVWTKEVFANYFAALITEPMFPDINHQLNWLKTTTAASLSEDRTQGSTSIRQDLDNLRNAGLVYGNIIYNKAPVMMLKLVEIMGEEAFRDGIRQYLKDYGYGNATWDDLIEILDARSDEDLASFSEVWVNKVSMPHIKFAVAENKLEISQHDPLQRGLQWPQKFDATIVTDTASQEVEVDLTSNAVVTVPLPESTKYILPNTDGRGYGYFMLEKDVLKNLMQMWHTVSDDTARQSLLMTLFENYQHLAIEDGEWLRFLVGALREEQNVLIASTLCGYLREPMRIMRDGAVEAQLLEMSNTHHLPSCRVQLLRTLISSSFSEELTAKLYDIWRDGKHPMLSQTDYMSMAYELALRMPDMADNIIKYQRERIENPDRQRQFDFISRAVSADETALDALFEELLQAENRRIEPWAESALAYLNHPLRTARAVKYIRPALDVLQEVQRTGDIFFPRGWVGSLLGNHRSEEAYAELMRFLEDNPDYPVLLRNKIMQAAWTLNKANSEPISHE
ncbi:MAG: ERAP1-like C-terminal domain-containing protein [Alistipes sp.]|nr:ERAP1-like C-terminal domain-containing protein [Alistipes sp.]